MKTIKELQDEIKKKRSVLELLKKIIGIMTKKEKLEVELQVRIICRWEELSEKETDLIVAVIYAESGMNPKAINKNRDGTTDYGLCQYNSKWYIGKYLTIDEALNDTDKCVKIMIRRYREGALNDWYGYRHGSYVNFL